MKTSTLLTYLLTTAATTSAATVPTRSPPTRARDGQHPLVLLHTLAPVAPSPSTSNFRLAAAATNADTRSSRGGAILTAPSTHSNTTTTNLNLNHITTAEAFFRVPSARVPTHGPTGGNPTLTFAASFWVGIDSSGSRTPEPGCGASLRAGVDTFWDSFAGGEQTPFAWYQFAPGQRFATGFEGFRVAEGDVVRFRLETPSSSSSSAAAGAEEEEGTGGGKYAVVAENFGANVTCDDAESCRGLTPLVSVRKVLPAPGEGEEKLCGGEAAWMVEDFPLAGMPDIPLPLANFTRVEFNGAGVRLEDGTERSVLEVQGVKVVDIHMEEQGGRLTRCGVLPGMKVRCTRVVGDEDI
ncbi:hypothetical protein VTJ49DRAFT_7054 [Mycothermus thermophilus]|uniref:Uncharacterized protein n=1 Tax=Humicola insolens TaxID=85995 RepID=A0ABR3VHV4_HUMIN